MTPSELARERLMAARDVAVLALLIGTTVTLSVMGQEDLAHVALGGALMHALPGYRKGSSASALALLAGFSTVRGV